MANPARAYLTTQVETTSQGELLIMLYDAAIKFLKRAKIEIDNKDFAKKGIYISKAMAIIHELSECLNKEKGGDITPKLSQLYMFCTSHLIKANIRLDKKKIDEVIQILDGLRSAYAQIIPEVDGKSKEQLQAEALQANPTPAKSGTLQASPSIPPQAAPKHSIAQPTAPSQQSAPQQPVAQDVPTATKASQQEAAPSQAPQQEAATSQQPETPATPPQPPTPPAPPKLRTAFNAAKFRAANAYSNSNNNA